MTKSEKAIHKMKVNPKDWRIELLCVPAHRPIKPIYVKNFIALIEALEVDDEHT